MAKSARDQLFDTLRASCLRKRTAKILSEAAAQSRRAPERSQDVARSMIAELRKAADDLESRITGKPTSSDRSAAAERAAATRASNARSRSASAKKAAATRQKSAASSSASGTRTAAKRTASSAKATATSARKTASSAGSTAKSAAKAG